MKSQKGVTLISLIVYVIVMVIVVSIVAVISSYFYSNVKQINEAIDPISEYTTFNSYFSEEANHETIKVLECQTNEQTKESYIAFSNGVQYTYIPENEGIYRNQVKIAKGIKACTFSTGISNGKNIVEVNLKAGDMPRNTTYTLKN